MAKTSHRRKRTPRPAPDPDAAIAAPDEQDHFLNRETQWLIFNKRVLHMACDERTPLLERIAFLAIFNSNLDEYFQKRVGGLKRQIKAGLTQRSPDGRTATEQLHGIREQVLPMLAKQAECFAEDLKPKLSAEGIHLLPWAKLSDADQQTANAYFEEQLFPLLTPLAVDPGHPFPFLSNLSTSLGVMLRPPAKSGIGANSDAAAVLDDPDDPEGPALEFARVKVPAMMPQWVALHRPGERDEDGRDVYRFVALIDIIRQNLGRLFEGMEVVHCEPFRITRNADLERDEEDAEDLLELVNQELRDRRFASCVRLEVDAEADHPMVRYLLAELGLREEDIYRMTAELDYTDLFAVHAAVDRPDLKYPKWKPMTPPRLVAGESTAGGSDVFATVSQGDLLVHHPYESFEHSVEAFIKQAARDPKVVAIKLTLYRTGTDSPFIPTLIAAAEAGKQVVCLVELKARFDEERNVQLARRLEKAGVHVVYGLVGLKTHTKTALVVREEDAGMKVYAHIGTGNYHSKTANLYTDLGLFTADKRITRDLVELFHFLTGRSLKEDFDHLLIAPVNMRRRFGQLIQREIDHAAGWVERGSDPADPDRPSIVAKMNQLEDHGIARRLYAASRVGVKVELFVRGFCCIRPGVPGLSENIEVSSVIGRFLEHSRVFRFHNAGEPETFIGSADWMYRNLNNRVECITPIYDPALRKRIDHLLDILRTDRRLAWDMDADGNYTLRRPEPGEDAPGTHERLMAFTRSRHE
ncbi:polyphosphate kinase 1 [Phycisphaera mikurensis]|uniref:Polyphosphate kinase n=1 Tax=Phycisphaera mikurensis (strain NBRC 102666 / KCTC 22515 / FYK2301M01) TaxID=1142394 RepID=I0IIS0_PHYMF|nr:polyphosphate kinase 1 [Phycisphaera mikurensis]MBB6442693.1 polyphosphate kinase [Phycisphaera mikurensis]BAM05158.1 polyphosphate kinase [Phycisphaera mikurensis NBRC 102666]